MGGEWSAEDRTGQEWAERAYARRQGARRVHALEQRLAKAERELRRLGDSLGVMEQTAALLETEAAVYSERMA
jgi:hypothetical protein